MMGLPDEAERCVIEKTGVLPAKFLLRKYLSCVVNAGVGNLSVVIHSGADLAAPPC
jgi:hypothetical protein